MEAVAGGPLLPHVYVLPHGAVSTAPHRADSSTVRQISLFRPSTNRFWRREVKLSAKNKPTKLRDSPTRRHKRRLNLPSSWIRGFSATAGHIHNSICKNTQLCSVSSSSRPIIYTLVSWCASSNRSDAIFNPQPKTSHFSDLAWTEKCSRGHNNSPNGSRLLWLRSQTLRLSGDADLQGTSQRMRS